MDTKEVSDSKKMHRSIALSDLHYSQPPVAIPHIFKSSNELKSGDEEDEGYISRPPSIPHSTHSFPTASIPPTIPEINEDLETISFGCADHKAPKVLNPPIGHSFQSLKRVPLSPHQPKYKYY